MTVRACDFHVPPMIFGLFPTRTVSLDPICLLKEGTFGYISDTAKSPAGSQTASI